MIGRLNIAIDDEASKVITSRERLWEPSFKSLVLSLVTDLSYRKTAFYTNTFLFRTDDGIKDKTLDDLVTRTGKQVTDFRNELRDQILTENGFNPETGELEDSSKLPDCVKASSPAHSEEELSEFAETIARKVEEYNNDHEVKITKPVAEIINSLEVIPEDAVIVCIDEVGVKHQKEYRKPEIKEESQKKLTEEEIKLENAETVETAIAYVRSSEGTYRIAEKTVFAALLTVLAYLLNNNLLTSRKLLFFTDGARNLKTSIEKIFAFRQFTINLDWIHVKSYCYQLLTMALKGGKQNLERNEKIRNRFFAYLWVGDVQGAKGYLDGIDKDYVKNDSMIESVKKYLDRKSEGAEQKYFYCYQMRKELDLINSSNQGEKSNDMIVAQRQKHNGMSWVVDGSANLGHLKELSVNQEDDIWYRTATLPFKPNRLTEEIVNQYHYQA